MYSVYSCGLILMRCILIHVLLKQDVVIMNIIIYTSLQNPQLVCRYRGYKSKQDIVIMNIIIYAS